MAQKSIYDELNLAKELAMRAGEEILKIYGKPDIKTEEKTDENDYRSPLTEADKAANEAIVPELKKQFPEYSVLSEEDNDEKDRLMHGFVWIIDPLDGTKEFLKKNGEFTVNIALVFQGEPILGVIYAPVNKEMYWAVKGNGAYLEKDGHQAQLKVSDTDEFQKMILVTSRSHSGSDMQEMVKETGFMRTVAKGSSIKGCLVAMGGADAYIRLGPVREWDVAAMDIIVQAAGGRITTLAGKPLIYNRQDTLIDSGFLVSNGRKHEELLSIARKYKK